MKKVLIKIGIISAALLFVFMLMGCKATRDIGVYDTSVPSDQLCTLEIAGNILVTKFNGNDVVKKWGYTNKGGSNTQTVVKIPQGTHEIQAFFAISDYFGTSVTFPEMSFNYDFAAKHTYRLGVVVKKNGKETDEYKVIEVSLPEFQYFTIVNKGETP